MFTFLRHSLQYAVVLLCAALIAGTSGCSDVSGPCVVETLTITPNPLVLIANASGQFTATGTDTDGNDVEITSAWSVVGAGGTINASTGMFTAGSVLGTFTNTVQVASSGLTAHATVIVISAVGPLASITVTPNPANLVVDGSQIFVATGRDAAGNIVPITPAWAVVADGGVINSSSGMFVAAALTAGAGTGSFPNTVRASSGGISGYATVNVAAVPPGPLATITVLPNPANLIVHGTQDFIAVGKDANGEIVEITPVWSVVAGGGAIDDSSGQFTAGSVSGAFPNTVQASSGAISGFATVNVSAGNLAFITVAPNPANLAVNGSQQFTAIGRDIDSNIVAITPVWSVVANGGTINGSSGMFTAGTVTGAFPNTVRATSGGLSGFATVNVSSGVLATITVTPNPANLVINGVQQFVATGKDANGNLVAVTPVWSVVAGGGAINSGSGNFTAGTVTGSYPNTVRASSGSISGFATVNVGSGALATITVTPNPANLAVNGIQQFVATGRDANGNVVTITPAWSVVAGGGVVNSGSGVFTAGTVTGSFPNTVRASSGGLSGFATVNVSSGVLATITVTPNPDTLQVGELEQFIAVGRDANGNIVAITPTWSVVANGGAINSSSGAFITGSQPGTFLNTIRASSGGVSGFATVVVLAGPLATIAVTPNPDTLEVNNSQQFIAIGRDAQGNLVSFTPSWSVVANGGTINSSSGNFTAGSVTGTFPNTVRAASGSIAGFATVTVIDAATGPLATITVTPNPDTLFVDGVGQFVATGRDANGNIVAITPSWSVVAGGGTINSSSGEFTAGSVTGTFVNTIRATSGSISGFATVTVIDEPAGPLATITVTPNPDTLAIGESQLFVAVGRDADGNIVAITPTWSVVAGGGVINSASGLFGAGTATGTFVNTIRATSGGISGFATVAVTPGLLTTISVTPNPAILDINEEQAFIAAGQDAYGNVVVITPTWSVISGGGTINSSSGIFTAGDIAGTFPNTVRATSGSRSGYATVIVNSGALASITVTPNPDTMSTSEAQQFVATGRDADDNIVIITPTWSVVAGGGAINSGSGMFTAGLVAGTFTNTVRATSGSVSGFATVTVTPGPLASVTVSPNPDTTAVNETQQFVAVGRDADSNIVPIVPVWSVVASGGSINSGSGLFTAGSLAGTFDSTVRATSGLVSGYATVTVVPGSLVSISVTPNPDTTVANGSQQFIAVGKDADSNVVAIVPTWSVVAGGGSINSGSGMFTAGSVAGTFTNTVEATSGLVSGYATVTVIPGSLVSISVTPNPDTMAVAETQQFIAVGKDADSNIVAFIPLWSVVAGGGSIDADSGMFTAGSVGGTFDSTVRATDGLVSGYATVVIVSAPPPDILGSAATFAGLASSTLTNTGPSTIVGDVGVSPGTDIVGIPAGQPTGGSIHAGDGVAATAMADLTTGYNTLAGMACGTNLTGQDLGGMTLAAGTYCFNTSAQLTGALTFDAQGDSNAVFVIQMGSTLTTASNSSVVLIGGAKASNVYYQVGSSATLGTNTAFQGSIVALASVTLNTGSSLNGRALGVNGAVTLDFNAITLP